jgi:hypothetical protein
LISKHQRCFLKDFKFSLPGRQFNECFDGYQLAVNFGTPTDAIAVALTHSKEFADVFVQIKNENLVYIDASSNRNKCSTSGG